MHAPLTNEAVARADGALSRVDDLFARADTVRLAGVPAGYEGAVLARLLATGGGANRRNALVFVARDYQRSVDAEQSLAFFAPWARVLPLPAWDCLPYDRVSPGADVEARRLATLAELASETSFDTPTLVVTTANALLQRLPPKGVVADQSRVAKPGQRLDLDDLARWLGDNGFERTPTVRAAGEFAVRGGLLDLWAPGTEAPLRLDFFGDTLESIRSFDAASQRTLAQVKAFELSPMSELFINDETVARFRRNYLSTFGAATRDDALYEAVSEKRRYAGAEHWLPLFYETMDTLFDYVAGVPFVLDHQTGEALDARRAQVVDHYESRKRGMKDRGKDEGTAYKPVEPDSLYMTSSEVRERLAPFDAAWLTPFEEDDEGRGEAGRVINLGARQGRNFAPERQRSENVFAALADHAADMREGGRRVVVASWTDGARQRLAEVLKEHGLTNAELVDHWGDVQTLAPGRTALAVMGIDAGFVSDELAVIAEADVLGDRLVKRRAKRKGADVLQEASALAEGDLIVHVEHGIGRFAGLRTLEAAGAPHDCLELHYQGTDKLFLPVENLDLLTRYGAAETEVQLDKLGGAAWQARKAKLKKRILDMAADLIKIAAERQLKRTEAVTLPDGVYGEFAARFPYEETDDQQNAIEAVVDDLASGHPMDRLICGDVGFGKTEVAIRAAFAVAMAGKQVAVVVPTTLLARQHYRNFAERFHGLPVKVAHASRLVGSKELTATRNGLADGTVDIVVGTHALLSKNVTFDRLGLLVIDEEQRFGVKHKERLKEMRTDVHVLTLSATPIPRTLQLALTGVRDLSLITTAPIDRMAVRTFVSPFDGLVIREALLRERYRGGQSFYVCPRVSDLRERAEWLAERVPELKVATAHGQMAPGELDDIMNAFYDGQYDVLLSTTIVESGLDIPTANTLIVHRADMFGLAQLYQLRGRVGRSKTRAYAFLTLPPNKTLTPTAERRLKVLQSLDTLGAGFQLASHDLDIRGSGNLLGEEQSGHIREVGYELYQQMLEEAVAEMKDGGDAEIDERWSPQISIGTTVMIPESYVPDLTLRMNLYRRLAELSETQEIEAFAAEFIDRFGPMPDEVDHLLKIVFIKALCRKANVEKLDAGPKGVVVQFRDRQFSNPAGLVKYIGEQGAQAKIRPDQSIVLQRDWATPDKRLRGSAVVMTQLAKLAA